MTMQSEQRNVRNLVRVVSGCVAWPALSISAFMMIDIDEHLLHILGLLPLGLVAVVAFFQAEALARRFVPDDPLDEGDAHASVRG